MTTSGKGQPIELRGGNCQASMDQRSGELVIGGPAGPGTRGRGTANSNGRIGNSLNPASAAPSKMNVWSSRSNGAFFTT